MDKKNQLRIGIGQINPTVGDIDANAEKIISYIQRGEQEGIQLLVFPELAISGYPIWDLANKKQFVHENLKALKKIASSTAGTRITVAVGFIDRGSKRANGKNHNAIAIIRNGKIIHRQYKTLLPTYDVFLERIFFEPGENQDIFRLNGIPLATSICEDIWDDHYPVKPVRVLAGKGAKILINISASPFHQNADAVRRALVQRKAKEYGLWIIYVNQVGGQDDLVFDGRSLICDPQGNVYYQAAPFSENLFTVDLDLSRKRRNPCPAHTVNQTQEMYQALQLGLADYIRKNGFRKVVVGLSGGIDSALVATIAADALGPGSVIGVSMPGPYSSSHSIEDARELAENLGVEFRTRPISESYELFMARVREEKKKRGCIPDATNKISLAMENLQSRLRGIHLMYISNDEGAVLLSTGNKSELAMGYGTLYGDMCGGLAVLGDVYKSDVYRLCEFRNRSGVVIPRSTIEKPPSAELRPNQKDTDSLPDYAVLDKILAFYIEKNLGFDDICARLRRQKIPPEIIRDVIAKVDLSEYKRRQLPPSLRVTEKAWFGRRMPITNRFRQR